MGVDVLRVEDEGSPVPGLGSHRVALDEAKAAVGIDMLRVEDEGSPVRGLGPYRVALGREEEARM